MADSAERRFEAAINVVKSMPKKGAYQPSYDTMLKFYGYFKQAKEGECRDTKPGFWDVIKKAKWEAWSALGDLPKQDAMECYVNEVKKVMEEIPENEEMADFSLVLKEFYETVYEPVGEDPPPMLRIFKKDDTLINSGDFTANSINDQEQGNMEGDESIPNGLQLISDKHSNEQHLISGLVNGNRDKLSNVDGISVPMKAIGTNHEYTTTDTSDRGALNEEETSDGADCQIVPATDISVEEPQPLYIFEIGSKGRPTESNDSGFQSDQHGREIATNETVPELKPQRSDVALYDYQGVITSDESDEEFCDSLDPEHLSNLQNGHSDVGVTNITEIKELDSSNGSSALSSNSPLTDSEDSRFDIPVTATASLLTSTPFTTKHAAHVTFADQVGFNEDNLTEKEMMRNGYPVTRQDLKNNGNVVHNVNGMLKATGGIPKQRGGGTSPSRQFNKQADNQQQQQQQGQQSKAVRNPGAVAKGGKPNLQRLKDYSDSDSDDDEKNESMTSSVDRDEINERILAALEGLQRDMQHVLRQLQDMEHRTSNTNDTSLINRAQQWWKQYIPSKTVLFLVLWPFVINILFHYYRKRRILKKT
ncbi:acyl-CoA-binding domain-containing protein 5A isoform X1 [Nematostella vectensis]|uniref:acyl-CoA-binding domain-containing protein 5A isoform X1 n=2 Tax=Nematostella vectensis TaxID=45351 RepID=UPI002077246F|nr:acyl-CoA-binding domain-containing protein 5A isoform X1 [Nematostella vectensis]